eukprot:CAMPEP_0201488962 /NCGR_PEP_ID=MMETSP0151_2-20130828/20763_1 /ASSEMBLY_ACC=CAM_ASM_000257 /TAXON_ID=200890 /ORGANISM="Paramoeba atlantica, Strain 621/1 / CCAP 1560/9" /LENGTH=147 /DNA_ID=CAMNT_0047874411 /DNA_START=118 /DNA_END=561 /DNA_ORIENTATION=+
MLSSKILAGVGVLGFILASGIMLNILACALFDNNWWSFFVVLAYVTAPIPEFVARHIRCVCGGYCGEDDGDERIVSQGVLDAAHFTTGFLVASGLLLPLVLAHTRVIGVVPMILSLVGGLLVYGAIATYLHIYHESLTDELDEFNFD